jgi:predicted RNA-binding Zn-ribbon protein involved in translation (DUF1610 family)
VSTIPPQVPASESSAREEPAPAGAQESNTGRKFPCPGCGAKLDFDPSQRALKCPYCGYAEQIDPTAETVRERNWEQYWACANDQGATIVGRSSEVQCKACAAVVLLEDKVVTDKCPYCGNDLENRPVTAENMILPEGILPFKVELKRAKDAFRQWVAARWFAPSDLRRLADLGQLHGIYVPFWTFDSMTYTHYTGQRGDNYQELETYVDHETYLESDGRGNTVTRTRPVTKTRIVTRIRWTPASGDVEEFFDDVLVCASKSIPDALMQELGPWDKQNYEPFQPEFLAGFQTERYTIGLEPGFDVARSLMEGEIRRLCCQDIGGDHQKLSSVDTQHTAITFKHVLQPVWLAPYRYRDTLYRIAVNARTGEVVGTRPYSVWKIVFAILAALGIVAAIVAASGVAQGSESPPPALPRAARTAPSIGIRFFAPPPRTIDDRGGRELGPFRFMGNQCPAGSIPNSEQPLCTV